MINNHDNTHSFTHLTRLLWATSTCNSIASQHKWHNRWFQHSLRNAWAKNRKNSMWNAWKKNFWRNYSKSKYNLQILKIICWTSRQILIARHNVEQRSTINQRFNSINSFNLIVDYDEQKTLTFQFFITETIHDFGVPMLALRIPIFPISKNKLKRWESN